MTSITNPRSLPAPVQQWFDDVLLSRDEPLLIYNKMAMKKRMPSRSGRIVRYRRFNNLARALVPLGDSGITPPAQSVSAMDIDAKVEWYGTYVILTDQVVLQNQDPVLNEVASLLAQSLRETDDQLTKLMLESTSSFVNCVNGSNLDTPTELTLPDIRAITFALIDASARMISDNIEGEDKFATAPIREAYWTMCHSNVLNNLEEVSGFVPTSQYASTRSLSAEWGSVQNTRWLYSPIGSITPNASALGSDVYNCFTTGRESYATIDQDGQSAEFIYQGLGSGNDPMLQRQTSAYKFAVAKRLLNDTRLINLRTTLS